MFKASWRPQKLRVNLRLVINRLKLLEKKKSKIITVVGAKLFWFFVDPYTWPTSMLIIDTIIIIVVVIFVIIFVFYGDRLAVLHWSYLILYQSFNPTQINGDFYRHNNSISIFQFEPDKLILSLLFYTLSLYFM